LILKDRTPQKILESYLKHTLSSITVYEILICIERFLDVVVGPWSMSR